MERRTEGAGDAILTAARPFGNWEAAETLRDDRKGRGRKKPDKYFFAQQKTQDTCENLHVDPARTSRRRLLHLPSPAQKWIRYKDVWGAKTHNSMILMNNNGYELMMNGMVGCAALLLLRDGTSRFFWLAGFIREAALSLFYTLGWSLLNTHDDLGIRRRSHVCSTCFLTRCCLVVCGLVFLFSPYHFVVYLQSARVTWAFSCIRMCTGFPKTMCKK